MAHIQQKITNAKTHKKDLMAQFKAKQLTLVTSSLMAIAHGPGPTIASSIHLLTWILNFS